MLQSLQIKNYAIIDDLNINFGSGLNVITGETGAGKSILMGALSLILGKRADSQVLFDKNQKCFVEGCFVLNDDTLKVIFDREELEFNRELYIRREIQTNGRSRAFINDSPVKLQMLKQISGSLVDLHQQNDHLELMSAVFRLHLLDALAKNDEHLRDYQEDFFSLQHIKEEIEKLKEQQVLANRDFDYWSFQLEELQNLAFDDGQAYQNAENLFKQLENAAEIQNSLSDLSQLWEGEGGLDTLSSNLQNLFASLEKKSKSNSPFVGRLESLLLELRALQDEVHDHYASTEISEEEKQELREKLDAANHMLTKHRLSDFQELLKLREDLVSKTSGVEDLQTKISALEKRKIEVRERAIKAAELLDASRRKTIPTLQERTVENLKKMGMKAPRLEVRLKAKSNLDQFGQSSADFLFSANRGSELTEIQNAASGGEISRVMLSLKHALARTIDFPTLIFDEIDTGISGEVAGRVGKMLQEMGESHQIISISHLPQIAGKAKQHFLIYKEEKDKRDMTFVKALNGDDRILEIAKMLSGENPGEAALENARDLIFPN